jgi:hypothetical protein
MGRYRRPDSKNARWASPGWARERTTDTRNRVELPERMGCRISDKRLSESRAFNRFVRSSSPSQGAHFLERTSTARVNRNVEGEISGAETKRPHPVGSRAEGPSGRGATAAAGLR